jgi:hypothetical protein
MRIIGLYALQLYYQRLIGQRQRCYEAQALNAFLWFDLLAYAATTVLSGLQLRDVNVNMNGVRCGPAMC